MSLREKLLRGTGKVTAPWILLLVPQAASGRSHGEPRGWAREVLDAVFDALLDALFRFL